MNLFTEVKRTKILLLVDNRADSQQKGKADLPNFRGSAFMDTEADPLEERVDLEVVAAEDELILNLKKKVAELEKRIKRLQSISQQESPNHISVSDDPRKRRRKFSELKRDFKCPHVSCSKIYGSQTSLKHHIKIKHSPKQQKN